MLPVILNLTGKRCLILGDNEEARRKADQLAAQGAEVELQRSPFRPGDLEGFYLAVAAGPDRSLNPMIASEARRRGVILNCLDDPEHCDFFFPSIHQQGDLIIAVSTQGTCPALAVRIRQRFEREFGPEYARFLDMARGLRDRLAAQFEDFAERRSVWYRIVDSQAIEMLREDRRSEAERVIEQVISPPR
jgi:siroheme synthase-like protein